MKKKQITIFIVDDDKSFSAALKADIETTFDEMPIKVFLFETGEMCMKRFNEEKPQVVILDYQLNSVFPEAVDGIHVLDWIKRADYRTNVIMLTSEDDIEIALKSFKHEASDYVVKTETKFKKINYSLFNLFKTMEARKEATVYKYLTIGILMSVALIFGIVLAIQIFAPGVLYS
jgi:DNA-binding NtrC family response regulator